MAVFSYKFRVFLVSLMIGTSSCTDNTSVASIGNTTYTSIKSVVRLHHHGRAFVETQEVFCEGETVYKFKGLVDFSHNGKGFVKNQDLSYKNATEGSGTKTEKASEETTSASLSNFAALGKGKDTGPAPTVCRYGFTAYRGVCYKAFGVAADLLRARDRCARYGDGGTLAVPKDRDINNFLIKLKNRVSTSSLFRIGLKYRRQGKNRWVWEDGQALQAADFQDVRLPSPRSGKFSERCIAYLPRNHRPSNKWSRVRCMATKLSHVPGHRHRKIFFICQKEGGRV